MSSPAAFLCRYAKTVELAAGVATTVNVPIDGARNWLVVVQNDAASAGDLDTVTHAASPLGARFEAPVSVSTGLPVAAGDALPGIRGLGEPITSLRVVLTSTAGATVHLEAGGW